MTFQQLSIYKKRKKGEALVEIGSWLYKADFVMRDHDTVFTNSTVQDCILVHL